MVRFVEAKCAVVKLIDGLVINTIMAQPSDEPPFNCELIEIMNDQPCDIGWYWNGTEFLSPVTPISDVES